MLNLQFSDKPRTDFENGRKPKIPVTQRDTLETVSSINKVKPEHYIKKVHALIKSALVLNQIHSNLTLQKTTKIVTSEARFETRR